MNNRMNQSEILRQAILSCLHKGLDDNQVIYSKVVDELGVPRPTVRRVARELRNELVEYVKILQNEIPKISDRGRIN